MTHLVSHCKQQITMMFKELHNIRQKIKYYNEKIT